MAGQTAVGSPSISDTTILWLQQKVAALEAEVASLRINQQPQPESVTGSVPHRSCAGCPEYGLDRDCSGKCP